MHGVSMKFNTKAFTFHCRNFEPSRLQMEKKFLWETDRHL